MQIKNTLFKATVITALALTLVACGSGGASSDSDILHIIEQDIPEDAYITDLRVQMATNRLGWATICNSIKGLNDQETIAFIEALDDTNPAATSTPRIRPGGTPVSGQEIDNDSQRRIIAIVRVECERQFAS